MQPQITVLSLKYTCFIMYYWYIFSSLLITGYPNNPTLYEMDLNNVLMSRTQNREEQLYLVYLLTWEGTMHKNQWRLLPVGTGSPIPLFNYTINNLIKFKILSLLNTLRNVKNLLSAT